jgi:hypothetical protein
MRFIQPQTLEAELTAFVVAPMLIRGACCRGQAMPEVSCSTRRRPEHQTRDCLLLKLSWLHCRAWDPIWCGCIVDYDACAVNAQGAPLSYVTATGVLTRSVGAASPCVSLTDKLAPDNRRSAGWRRLAVCLAATGLLPCSGCGSSARDVLRICCRQLPCTTDRRGLRYVVTERQAAQAGTHRGDAPVCNWTPCHLLALRTPGGGCRTIRSRSQALPVVSRHAAPAVRVAQIKSWALFRREGVVCSSMDRGPDSLGNGHIASSQRDAQ